MTTDPSVPDLAADHAARLEALRARSGRRDPVPAAGTTPMTMLPVERRSPRRRHPAMGARLVTAGMSVAAAVGLIAVMANGEVALATSALAPPSLATTTAVAIVPTSDAGSPSATAAAVAPSAAPVAGAPPIPGAAVPVTTAATRPGSTAAKPAGATSSVQASGGAGPAAAPAAVAATSPPATSPPATAPAVAAPAPTTAAPAPTTAPPPPVTTAAGS